MELDRRSFLGSVGSVVTVTFLEPGSPGAPKPLGITAYAQAPAAQGGTDVSALRDRINKDGEFLLKARYWDSHVRLEIGDRPYDLVVERGQVSQVSPASAPGKFDVRIAGPIAAWS